MTATEIKRDGQLSEVMLGNLGAQVNLRGYDGVKKNPVGGATLSTGNYGLIEQTTHGKHVAVPLAATAVTAAPTPANSVLLVDDAGLAVGAGAYLRLYDAAGADYVQLASDADGGLVLGGSGASAGLLSFSTLRLFNGADFAQLTASAGGGLALGGSGLTAGLFTASVVRVGDGSAASAAYGFSGTGGVNDGMYRVSDGRVGMTADGTKVLEIVNTGGVFGLGIGMSPSVPLDAQRGSTDYIGRLEQTSGSAGAKVLMLKSANTAAGDPLFYCESGGVGRLTLFSNGALSLAGAATLAGGGTLSGTFAGNPDFSGSPTFSGWTWTSFTPGVTQSAPLSMTVNYARYRIIGKTVFVMLRMTYASGASVAGNAIVITGIPAAIQPARAGSYTVVGTMVFYDSSANTPYVGFAESSTATTVLGYRDGATAVGAFGVDPNVAIAAGDVVAACLAYELV